MIHIITPCSRPENLSLMKHSIPKECNWVIVYDSTVKEYPEIENASVLYSPFTGGSGNPNRNYALDNLEFSDTDWIYILDDDNIIHPKWYRTVKDFNEDHLNIITWGQVWKNYDIRLEPVPDPRVGNIDTSCYMVRGRVMKNLRYEILYEADGVLANEVVRQYAGILTLSHEYLGYYNYLRTPSDRDFVKISDNNTAIEIFDSKIQTDYTKILKQSLDNAINSYSKLSEFLWAIQMEGMSGQKFRHFINNVIASVNDPRYLEIGSWKGSTLCSAIYNNNVTALAIDNWSEFGGPRHLFMSNLNYCTENCAEDYKPKVEIKEQDFNQVQYSDIGKYNVYFFDGPHTYQDQYNALTYALDALDEEFIFICDDWNWQQVREGTTKSIFDLNLDVLYSVEINSQKDFDLGILYERSNWHNGYYIAVLRKTS